jgi:peroxiredoxin
MYKSKGYPVIAINPNDTAQYPDDGMEAMKVRAAEKGFTFPYLRDETQEIALAYGAEKTPHVYVLQKITGTFMAKYVGAIDNNPKDANAVTDTYVQRAVNELLEGKPVSLTSTKAIGCGIKWK